ncbi:hypothetical protein NQ317_001430 [Molorchus minor]|uniref:Uncharacterized protein n=1 Tax=Molorchus minor TaxID=1323400 RepID=A0ABQ9JZE6_9CUCU|nr:hypothetical protein NQ317_001430 [Molorchus minor]
MQGPAPEQRPSGRSRERAQTEQAQAEPGQRQDPAQTVQRREEELHVAVIDTYHPDLFDSRFDDLRGNGSFEA